MSVETVVRDCTETTAPPTNQIQAARLRHASNRRKLGKEAAVGRESRSIKTQRLWRMMDGAVQLRERENAVSRRRRSLTVFFFKHQNSTQPTNI